jgi:hypothetical protein
MKQKIYFASKRNEKLEAKTCEKIDIRFSLEHSKTMRNGSRFASKLKKILSETGAPYLWLKYDTNYGRDSYFV